MLSAIAALARGEIVRAELNRAGLSGPDTLEVIVARPENPPGATVPRRSHHGDEHLIVPEGGIFATPDGTPVPFDAGMVARFARGEPLGGLTVTGDAPIVLSTIHVVDKGKPLNVPAN